MSSLLSEPLARSNKSRIDPHAAALASQKHVNSEYRYYPGTQTATHPTGGCVILAKGRALFRAHPYGYRYMSEFSHSTHWSSILCYSTQICLYALSCASDCSPWASGFHFRPSVYTGRSIPHKTQNSTMPLITETGRGGKLVGQGKVDGIKTGVRMDVFTWPWNVKDGMRRGSRSGAGRGGATVVIVLKMRRDLSLEALLRRTFKMEQRLE